MATRNLSASQPIKNIARDPPERTHFTSDGEEVREKLNPLRSEMKRKMLDKTGGSYWLSLANGYAIKKAENMYGPMILDEKIKKGHLPLDCCPVTMGYVEPVSGDVGCGSKLFVPEEPCKHLLKIADTRKAAYAKRQGDYVRHFKKNEEREVGDLIKALKAVVTERAEGVGFKTAAKPGRPRKGVSVETDAAEPEELDG